MIQTQCILGLHGGKILKKRDKRKNQGDRVCNLARIHNDVEPTIQKEKRKEIELRSKNSHSIIIFNMPTPLQLRLYMTRPYFIHKKHLTWVVRKAIPTVIIIIFMNIFAHGKEILELQKREKKSQNYGREKEKGVGTTVCQKGERSHNVIFRVIRFIAPLFLSVEPTFAMNFLQSFFHK